MTLSVGSYLGPYQVLAQLGAGGMGEIYRAKDPRLNREVAIKVLPDRLNLDQDILGRFQRENMAIAALSHRARRLEARTEGTRQTVWCRLLRVGQLRLINGLRPVLPLLREPLQM